MSHCHKRLHMSPIAKRTTTEYPGTDTESSSFKRHTNELFTHWIEVEEPEDFVEFVKNLTKATWFCEVAEA
jgi:hypothetical protein